MSISTGYPSHAHPGTTTGPHTLSSVSNPDWQHEEQEAYSEEGDEEIEEEEDDEVDQLVDESGGEDPNETTEEDPPARDTGRVPGTTLLPTVKLENIMQADGVTGNLALSREGMFVLSVAVEEFIKRFTAGGHREAIAEGRSSISYNDMANTTRQYQEFMFLRDMIPAPMSLADALEMREAREKEMFDEDPSLSTQPISIISGHPSHAYHHEYSTNSHLPSFASGSNPSKPKKHRSTNGKEKVNGTTANASASAGGSQTHFHTSTAASTSVGAGVPVVRGQWVPGHGVLDARPWSHWAEPHAGPPPAAYVNVHEYQHQPAAVINGSAHHAPTNGSSTTISRSGTATGAATPAAPSGPPTSSSSPSVTKAESASASPVDEHPGSASGVLQGPGGGRSGDNRGRTIYSQES